jgi:hypothetical protein
MRTLSPRGTYRPEGYGLKGDGFSLKATGFERLQAEPEG